MRPKLLPRAGVGHGVNVGADVVGLFVTGPSMRHSQYRAEVQQDSQGEERTKGLKHEQNREAGEHKD